MRINKYLMPLIAIGLLIGTVFAANATGYWQTSGREMINPSVTLSSAEIKGWMSLDYLSDEFEIPLDELRTMLGVPADTPGGVPLKELEYLISVGDVRAVIGAAIEETPVVHEEHD